MTTEKKWIGFNLNEYVRVKLTNSGRDELRRQWIELTEKAPSLGAYTEPEVDADGWSQFQLWSLMQKLGPLCRLGFDPPFDTAMQFEVTADREGDVT